MYMGNQGKIMRKLLGKTTVDSPSSDSIGITSSPVPQSYRPSASQNAAYPASAPIGCIDKSPDGRSAVLAGRHVLKTVRFDGLSIRDGTDLRALIQSQPASKAGGGHNTADQLSIKDVKWGSAQGDSTIFTACANGNIFQYDLTRLGSGGAGAGTTGFEFIQMREDSRQVNTLDINPHRGTYLLSGSQDGIVRCFDVRTPVPATGRPGLTFRQAGAPFKCNADGIRHVSWSPKDGFYFACGSEQGIVLRWDIRKASAPILRIKGHDKACSSISWHPDGEHLASAGWDSKCCVWDMSKSADKRQKPKWTISTPAPVAVVSWRPAQWSATSRGKRAAQVAVSYDGSVRNHGITAVHIWDFARPTMPYKEVDRFDNPPSALLWHDQDLLWAAGQDGFFNQCDVAFAPKVIDRVSMSSMAFSPRGDVVMFLDERPAPPRPRPVVSPATEVLPPASLGSSPTPMLSISRSDSEDDAVGSFLAPGRRRPRRRRGSTRSAQIPQILGNTPPSSSNLSDDQLVNLEQTLKVTGIYKTRQAMAIGHVPSAPKVNVYHYLTTNYLEILNRELPRDGNGNPIAERVARIMEQYARVAEKISQFRLAQTWRILAYATDLLLSRRAQYHRAVRLQRTEKKKSMDSRRKEDRYLGDYMPEDVSYRSGTANGGGEETPRKGLVHDSRLTPAKSLLSEEIESTSNVATPLARPHDDGQGDRDISDEGVDHRDFIPGKKLTPISEPESFILPPAVHQMSRSPRQRLDSVPLSIMSHDSERTQASHTSQISSTDGYDFYDTEVLAMAIDVPAPKKQAPLSLEYLESPTSRRESAKRHDSDESFSHLFSASAGSRRTVSRTASAEDGCWKNYNRIDTVPEHQFENESDYGSRIRGQDLQDSPESVRVARAHLAMLKSETELSAEDDLMATQTTQTTTDSFESQSQSNEYSSVPAVGLTTPSPERHPFLLDPRGGYEDDVGFNHETDHLPWPDDPLYPYPIIAGSQGTAVRGSGTTPPLNPYTLLSRALSSETRSSALNASAMVLLLKPLVPESIIDTFQATAILKQHHSRLMDMKLFVEAALLRNLCVRGWPDAAGSGPLALWGDNYTSIFTPAQRNVKTAFTCPRCRKPREISRLSDSTDSVWICGRCRDIMAPCAVCGHREATPNTPPAAAADEPTSTQQQGEGEGVDVLSTWWYCPGCAHGGHATCMQGWHAAFADDAAAAGASFASGPAMEVEDDGLSDGCCPLDGCGHACLPGRWRAEREAARTEEVSRAVREQTRTDRRVSAGTNGGGVRGDGNEVVQSRAVESVREALAGSGAMSGGGGGGGGGGLGSPGVGILSSSPGRERVERMKDHGGERERRKSVKFVETG